MQETSLPTEHDFDPFGGDLDAQVAWRNFGGLTLEQARMKFLEMPEVYHEDFMFMGGKAFAYYFPVIEDFLKSVPEGGNCDDHQAWILACGIQAHFEGEDLPHVQHLTSRVIALAEYIRGHISRFGYDEGERNKVANEWSELARHVTRMTRALG
jgi:hypothetical protein